MTTVNRTQPTFFQSPVEKIKSSKKIIKKQTLLFCGRRGKKKWGRKGEEKPSNSVKLV